MRATTGPSGTIFRVEGAGTEQSLRSGALVSVSLLERIEPGLFRVAVAGRTMVARLDAGLEAGLLGSVFRARVERAGGALVLRVAPGRGEAASALLARAGLPEEAASRMALGALLAEGAAPLPASLMRVRLAALGWALGRAFGSRRAEAEAGAAGEARVAAERARLAARMEAKGLPATPEAFDALLTLSGCGSEGGGGSSEASGRGSERSEDAEPRPQEKDSAATIPESALPRELGAFLKSLALRSDGEGSFLSLFNHLRGPEGSWILLPFAFALDSVAFGGGFRIRLPYLIGGPGRIEADFSASSGGRTRAWFFELAFGGGAAPLLRLGSRDPELGAALSRSRPRLEAELAVHGCRVEIADPASHGDSAPEMPGGVDLDA